MVPRERALSRWERERVRAQFQQGAGFRRDRSVQWALTWPAAILSHRERKLGQAAEQELEGAGGRDLVYAGRGRHDRRVELAERLAGVAHHDGHVPVDDGQGVERGAARVEVE